MLFPEEIEGGVTTVVTGHSDKLTVELESVGPNMTRFVNGLDTDDETPDTEDRSVQGKKRERKQAKHDSRRKKRDKAPDNTKMDDGRPKCKPRHKSAKSAIEHVEHLKRVSERVVPWAQGDEDTYPNDWAEVCDCPACSAVGESILGKVKKGIGDMKSDDEDADWGDEEDSFDEKNDVFSDEDPEDVYDIDLELIERDPRKLKKLKNFSFADGPEKEEVERTFAIYLDRERAKVFKPQWCAAEFDPIAKKGMAKSWTCWYCRRWSTVWRDSSTRAPSSCSAGSTHIRQSIDWSFAICRTPWPRSVCSFLTSPVCQSTWTREEPVSHVTSEREIRPNRRCLTTCGRQHSHLIAVTGVVLHRRLLNGTT